MLTEATRFCFDLHVSRNVVVDNSFCRFLWSGTVVNPLCPSANLCCGCFLFGPCPVFCLVCCFLLTKRKSGWGFAGRRGCWSCVFLVNFDLPALMDLLDPCKNVFLTAYAHVRTEPQRDIGQTRGKKSLLCPG